jgi:3-phenylpropionate/cinnamic acid dioxygenase small subunit
MSVTIEARQDTLTLTEAMAFIWAEADLLDAKHYAEWLTLWRAEGLYVVPIDPDTEDFEATLNYHYDDAGMREARVKRLGSKTSMSVSAAARTVRTVSRFRIVEAEGARTRVRCAQHLVECKSGRERLYAADLTYDLVRDPGGVKLLRKVVRLVNATEALGGVAYLL